MGLIDLIFGFYFNLRLRTKIALFVICFSGWLTIIGGLGIYSTYTCSVELKDMTIFRSMSLLIGGMTALTICLAFFFGWLIAKSIRTPVNTICEALQRIAKGDLTTPAIITTTEEMGELANGVNGMQQDMAQLIKRITSSVHQMTDSSHGLRDTAGKMAEGARQMAMETAQLATASEEMTATSVEIAGNCQIMSDDAQEVDNHARIGAQIVGRTIAVMSQIENIVTAAADSIQNLGASSDKIGEIVATIEDIADQTNLLALNAAIEAARAGEQGRGFAVVADEVRALSERTSRATKEISVMIKDIQDKTKASVDSMSQGVREVKHGADEASRSEAAISDIQQRVTSLAMEIEKIATAANQQSSTTATMSHDLGSITEAVQQDAELSENTLSSAENLTRLGEELESLVKRFRVA